MMRRVPEGCPPRGAFPGGAAPTEMVPLPEEYSAGAMPVRECLQPPPGTGTPGTHRRASGPLPGLSPGL